MTVLAPEQNQPLDRALTKTPEPTPKDEHPTALQQTATNPKHPEVTVPHPDHVQAQQPTSTETTV